MHTIAPTCDGLPTHIIASQKREFHGALDLDASTFKSWTLKSVRYLLSLYVTPGASYSMVATAVIGLEYSLARFNLALLVRRVLLRSSS